MSTLSKEARKRLEGFTNHDWATKYGYGPMTARADIADLLADRDALAEAIREHRRQKADDRCIEDDDRLYAALGDGIKCDRRVGSKEEMLANCKRFIERRCEGGGWPSYRELEERLRQAEADAAALRDVVSRAVHGGCTFRLGSFYNEAHALLESNHASRGLLEELERLKAAAAQSVCTQCGTASAILIGESWCCGYCYLRARCERQEKAIELLLDAADAYAADQSRAKDPRCGLVQPITVAEANALNDAMKFAHAAIAEDKP